MDCIILAGGLGTRLSSVVPDKPKCMADVKGQPFINYILDEIESQGVIDQVILSLGYRYEQVIDWLKSKAFLFKTTWVVEKEQKGTGGAMEFAIQKAHSSYVMVMNGDTIFNINYADFIYKMPADADIFIALRSVDNADRYGRIELNEDNGQIKAFNEKSQDGKAGIINGGVYIIRKDLFKSIDLEAPYSFEEKILPRFVEKGTVYGHVFNDYFIDIGIPEDYNKFIEAQN